MNFKKFSFAIKLSIPLLAIMVTIQGCSESSADKRSKPSNERVQNTRVISIRMGDYYYRPDTIRIPAGTPVLLKLTNKGTVLHEFMAGQKFDEADEGFEEDLFSGVAVELKIEGKSVAVMEMGGMHHEAAAEHEVHESMEHEGMGDENGHESMQHEEAGESEAHEHGEMGHSHQGTMLHLEPGQTGSMQFTLPESKKGTWKIGCFLKTGNKLHYHLGMEGVLIVQ